MFGNDVNGKPYLADLMLRSNADLKRRGEPVVLRLNHLAFPPRQIEVIACGMLIEDPKEIERLAGAVEALWKPKGSGRSGVILTLRGSIAEDWTMEKRRDLELALEQMGIKNCSILRVEKGSIKLTLKLSPEDAERLFWAVHSGALDELDVIDLEHVRLPGEGSQRESGDADQNETTSEVELATTTPDVLPGEFRVLQWLGKGGCGTVWLAEDVHLGRLVALKTILPSGSPRPANRSLELLREEARLAASVRHRNVVQVYAWREGPAQPDAPCYLILQYVPGGSLAARVEKEGPLSWLQAARYVADVAEGLLEVHARGIIHRDVKPANLLWDSETDEALLTDFGISVRLADSGNVAGTPYFMPPEAFEGQLSPAQDVYGLAVSLFWLVTGSVPFPGQTREQIAEQARRGLPDPDPRCVDLPQALEQLIRASLAPDPHRRPGLREFVTNLRGTLNQLLADSLLSAPARAPAGSAALRLTVSRQEDRYTFVPVATTRPQPERLLRDLRRVPPRPERVDVRTGERVRIEVETDRPGYVTVFNIGPTGNLNLLYPAEPSATAAVSACRPLHVLDIELTPPAGEERLFALWTREPLPLRLDELLALAEQGRLPVSGPYRATRDMKRVQESIHQLRPEDWSVAVLNLSHRDAREETA
jgi:serine/threonine-protein kinase